MILSDKEIKKYLKQRKIIIEPAPNMEESLGSCSLDLRLGQVAKRDNHQHAQKKKRNSSTITLSPGEFVLAATLEYIELPDDLCGMLHGRSSLGRQGITVHSTAPLVDAGFKGKIVLELFHSGNKPIELAIGDRVCSLTFHQLTSPAQVPYYRKKGAKYLNQRNP